MSAEQRGQPSSDSLALHLDSQRQEILSAYERRLTENCSPLIVDEETRRQVLAQASEAFDEVTASLRSGEPVQDEAGRLSRNIGVSRAAHGLHPTESLQAAAEFFAAFIKGMFASLDIDLNSPLAQGTLALHQSIVLRIREAATAYNGFLIDKIYRAQVDERKLLARNLHDQVGTVIGVSYRQLELFSIYRESDPIAASIRVETATQALAQVISEIRQLTADMRLVEPLHGLEKALLDYVSAAKEDDMITSVVVNGDESWASDQVRGEVFLIVREALGNAIRHGRPGNVAARIDIAPHELRAAIQDDGSGFQVGKTSNGQSGLRSMQERAALLGGTFRLSSAVGKGTTVEILIPFEGARSAPGE
jgi:signal transduction histidine kinase